MATCSIAPYLTWWDSTYVQAWLSCFGCFELKSSLFRDLRMLPWATPANPNLFPWICVRRLRRGVINSCFKLQVKKLVRPKLARLWQLKCKEQGLAPHGMTGTTVQLPPSSTNSYLYMVLCLHKLLSWGVHKYGCTVLAWVYTNVRTMYRITICPCTCLQQTHKCHGIHCTMRKALYRLRPWPMPSLLSWHSPSHHTLFLKTIKHNSSIDIP